MPLMSPVSHQSYKLQALLGGLFFGCIVFMLIPLGQMVSLVAIPEVKVADEPVETAIPEVLDSPKVIETDPKDVAIDLPKETFEPPSLTALEAALNVDLSGYTGRGVAFDARMIANEIGNLILGIGDLTVVPVAIDQVSPVFPPEKKRNRISGRVVVEFVVRADGSTDRIRVIDSTDSEFNEAALRAIRKWIYRPGEKEGRAVACRMRITIPFQA